MCGITGFLSAEAHANHAEQLATVTAMKGTLSYRGPDETNQFVDDHVALGHTRLIVVDRNGGKQPMTKTDGFETYTIVGNGELYNTETVREKLKEKGHTFKSYSDTEVILTAYIEWKEHAVDHMNGIFAFAVWSHKAKTLYLARDKLGVKPLMYAYFPEKGLFVFGSEAKALLRHPAVEPIVTLDGVHQLVLGMAPPQDKTPFRDIHRIRPGWSIVISVVDGQLHKREWQYWQLKAVPHTDSYEETAKKVRDLLRASVERQLISDVPLGSLLSGGIDSSSVAMFAYEKQKRDGKDFQTFSIDFVDNDKHFKEDWFMKALDGPYIKIMAEHFHFNHKDFVMDINPQIDLLKEAMLAKDWPGMGDMETSLLWLCQNVKKNVVVALSGECSDEIFGGYVWFHMPEFVNSNTFPWTVLNKGRVNLLASGIKDKLHLEKYVSDLYETVMREVPRLEGEEATQARMREIVYLHIHGMMQSLLERKDVMSMRTGLEVRVPFADEDLIQYVYNIPWSIKAKDGLAKAILRDTMRGLLPDEIVDRAKTPYPKSHDPNFTITLAKRVEEAIKNGSPIFKLLDEKSVREHVARGVSGDSKNHHANFDYGFLLQIHDWMVEYGVQLDI